MAVQPFYFHSVPHYILGLVFLTLTRQFLFEHRVHDYNTPEALHWTRPPPCTGAALQRCLLESRVVCCLPMGRAVASIHMLPCVSWQCCMLCNCTGRDSALLLHLLQQCIGTMPYTQRPLRPPLPLHVHTQPGPPE